MNTAKVLPAVAISAGVLLVLAIGMAAVPAMIDQFVDFQLRIGNADVPLVRFLAHHRARVTLIVQGFYLLGLLIALPTMIRDGFFTPDATPPPAPAAAQPPLDYELDVATIILLAKTELTQGAPSYRVTETWRAPAAWRLAHPDPTLAPDMETHRLLGYTPREGQEVVLFYTDPSWRADSPIEFLPVAEGKLTFGLYDASVRQTLSVAELRRIVAEHTERRAHTPDA